MSIHQSNALTAARGELSGKYFIAKFLRFTVKNIEKLKYWNIEGVSHVTYDSYTLYKIIYI